MSSFLHFLKHFQTKSICNMSHPLLLFDQLFFFSNKEVVRSRSGVLQGRASEVSDPVDYGENCSTADLFGRSVWLVFMTSKEPFKNMLHHRKGISE